MLKLFLIGFVVTTLYKSTFNLLDEDKFPSSESILKTTYETILEQNERKKYPNIYKLEFEYIKDNQEMVAAFNNAFCLNKHLGTKYRKIVLSKIENCLKEVELIYGKCLLYKIIKVLNNEVSLQYLRSILESHKLNLKHIILESDNYVRKDDFDYLRISIIFNALFTNTSSFYVKKHKFSSYKLTIDKMKRKELLKNIEDEIEHIKLYILWGSPRVIFSKNLYKKISQYKHLFMVENGSNGNKKDNNSVV